MQHYHYTEKMRWDEAVRFLTANHLVFAPVMHWGAMDYQQIDREAAKKITYNHPRPSTPLKTFFLPIVENVTSDIPSDPCIIMGVPNCDLQGLALLDKMYLEGDFRDPYYEARRCNTTIIGCDCHHIAAHCHCASYGIDPHPHQYHDIALNVVDDVVILQCNTGKGEQLLEKLEPFVTEGPPPEDRLKKMQDIRRQVRSQLTESNGELPDYAATGMLLQNGYGPIWQKFAERCVSCGACTTSCPTCTCFLLSDRPGFEKVRSIDACQYPGFERVAAGEDPLKKLTTRFRNRYLCKYVWKSARFEAQACTGCGRCIDGCIGNINKNEMFTDMVEAAATEAKSE